MPANIPALALLALLSPLPQDASPGPTIPATVQTGLEVSVVNDRGSRIDGRVLAVSDRFVRLSIRGGATEIPIEQIVRIERPDTVRNGARTGLVIGMGSGLLASAVDPQGGVVLVTRTLGNGLICAGLGALIDAAIDGRKTLYEQGPRAQTRITPRIGPNVRAVAVSIDW